MNEYKIELSHITKEFKTKRQRIVAVQDTSFGVHEKELVCLVGTFGLWEINNYPYDRRYHFSQLRQYPH